ISIAVGMERTASFRRLGHVAVDLAWQKTTCFLLEIIQTQNVLITSRQFRLPGLLFVLCRRTASCVHRFHTAFCRFRHVLRSSCYWFAACLVQWRTSPDRRRPVRTAHPAVALRPVYWIAEYSWIVLSPEQGAGLYASDVRETREQIGRAHV